MASASQKPDLDSILDAALDELDHSDSDSDDEAATQTAAPSTASNSKVESKRTYGPAPPPAATDSSSSSVNLTPQEAELAASLEGMMEQFMNFGDMNEDGVQDAERAMEEMFMQFMSNNGGGQGMNSDLSGVPKKEGNGSSGVKKNDVKSNGGESRPVKSDEKKSSGGKREKKQSKGMSLLIHL